MVTTKKPTARKPTTKAAAYLFTVIFSYGPYKLRKDAEFVRKEATKAKTFKATAIKKLASGYKFQTKTQFGVVGAENKNKQLANIKKTAPSAKVSVERV